MKDSLPPSFRKKVDSQFSECAKLLSEIRQEKAIKAKNSQKQSQEKS